MTLKIDWTKVEPDHPKILVEELKKLYTHGSFEVTANQFIQDIVEYSEAEAMMLLSDVAEMGFLEKKVKYFCPFEECVLSEAEAKSECCPHCNRFFCDSEKGITSSLYFIYHGPNGRIVRWFLALHGMNTKGAWQEEFNWRVATTFRRSIPVAIYKYGILRPGAIIPFRQNQIMNKMIERLKILSGETVSGGFGGKPDVIAHSFGTWLLGHALKKDKKLNVGRVILLGSILRPDFEWEDLKKKGQVDAVLNHYGTKDFWAKIAHYIIPDSGPSGRYGFDKGGVINKKAIDYKHCDFFKEAKIEYNFSNVWWPFLQTGDSQLYDLIEDESELYGWKQAKWPLRATLLPFFIIILMLTALGFLTISLIEGIANTSICELICNCIFFDVPFSL